MRTEDGSIIQRCLDGEAGAFGILVDKYKAGIYAYAYDKLRNFQDAQDVTQEVFERAYINLRNLRRWESFAFWLYRIASNQCRRWFQARSRRPDSQFIEDQDPKALDRASLDAYRDSQMDSPLWEALDSLSDTYREVLILHYFGGMTIKDMARAIGVSPDAIGKRLSRARVQLREDMMAMMDTAFEEQRLQASFTFRTVEAIKRIKIRPMPRMAGLPWGLSLAAGIILTVLSLNSYLPIFSLTSFPTCSQRPVGARMLKTGEIPVYILTDPQTLTISGKKKDSAEAVLLAEMRFASNEGRIVFVKDGIIWIVDADGKNEKKLTDGQTPAWSPDGRQIAFSRRTDSQSHIYTMNADGSDIKQLTDGPVLDMSPTWSPDGKQIAFEREPQGGGPHHIYVMNVDGSNVSSLVKGDDLNAHTWSNAWSPDGTKIAFRSNRDVKWGDIYVMDADGANVERLTFNNSTIDGISWSPDGRKIAFGFWPDASNCEIYIMDADGKNRANITNTPGTHEFCPSWSPDGTKIVFCSNRDENYEIYVMDADGSSVQRLNVPVDEKDITMSWESLDWTASSFAVEPAGKLPTTWGETKTN